uniref:NAD-dependent protein deacetylase sirtuin-2 n=1 Tax=Sphenodon punctatus TaxID=8508 RepID=A0A8D0GET9_SPHPU
MDFLRNLMQWTLGLGSDKPEKVLEELTLEGVSKFLQSERCKSVVCLVGARISTSAGIPDFRSPGTGLYANLQHYKLPYPEAIFKIGYFKKHPEPFFALARELYPGPHLLTHSCTHSPLLLCPLPHSPSPPLLP